MTENERATEDNRILDFLQSRINRAQLFKAAAAGLALAAVPETISAATEGPTIRSYPYFPAVQGRYSIEPVQDILNLLVTVEHLGVTAVTLALTTYANQLQLSPLAQTVLQST